MNALHRVALALEIPRRAHLAVPSRCAVCGESPFEHHARLPDSFTDHEILLAPETDRLCAGCARILGGRPGDEPAPLRTTSILLVGGTIHDDMTREQFFAVLTEAPGEEFVVSWSRSKKKHHLLYAGVSTPRHYLIGSDGETIEYVPARDEVLVEAVRELKTTFPAIAIREGVYHQSRVCSFGVPRHAFLEAIVSVYRRGRPALLDLLLWCVPIEEHSGNSQEVPMIHPFDDSAAEFLGAVAYASKYRVDHGIEFWSGFFPHQVERFKHRPLETFTARLMESAQCSPLYADRILSMLRDLDAEATAQIEEAIRVRTSLVVALSYQRMKRMKEA